MQYRFTVIVVNTTPDWAAWLNLGTAAVARMHDRGF